MNTQNQLYPFQPLNPLCDLQAEMEFDRQQEADEEKAEDALLREEMEAEAWMARHEYD